jgi:type IV pilus assembly protein PilB
MNPPVTLHDADLPAGIDPEPTYRAGVTPPTRRGRSTRDVADILVDFGFADAAAVAAARAGGARPEDVLLERDLITDDELACAVAERFGLEHVDLDVYDIDLRAVTLVAADTARRHRAVPIAFLDRRVLHLAMADPGDVAALDEIAILTGHELQPAVAAAGAVVALIERFARLGDGLEAAEIAAEPVPTAPDLADAPDGAPVVKLVNSIIAQAAERGASDIHFDPGAAEMTVWLRIDGLLTQITTLPSRVVPGIVSRLKIMAGMDIAERRMPQDGRMTVTVSGRTLDLRLLTLPVVRGEGVVIRLLDKGRGPVKLGDIGLGGATRTRLEDALARAHGLVLVTGPTGAGKTTTLYAALESLHTGERSIVSIEDPVEYEIEGIKQVQVNLKTGLTFAAGLRSTLRADPDIVMVGEIRDRETAQTAIEAALTGHLVLSTLHTNDAPSAVARLMEMGVEPFLVASAVNCVVAQRLVRTLCPHCRTTTTVLPRDIEALRDVEELYEPVGCSACNGTGYRGRTGIYEVMPITDRIRELTLDRRSVAELGAAAEAEGMQRLRADGLAKAIGGETTIAEIARVAGLR